MPKRSAKSSAAPPVQKRQRRTPEDDQPSIPTTSEQHPPPDADPSLPKPPYPPPGDPLRSAPGAPASAYRYRVYDALIKVPPGYFTTYGALAGALGSSARAVGQAMRSNPYAPQVPCHRVLGSDFYIGGFSGQWGLDCARPRRKAEMLREEGLEVDPEGFVARKHRRERFWGVEEIRKVIGESA